MTPDKKNSTLTFTLILAGLLVACILGELIWRFVFNGS